MSSPAQRTTSKIPLHRRHTRTLYIIAKLHYVSVDDIRQALLYAPSSYEWVRKTVLELWQHHYLERQIVAREERFGSTPYAYRLGSNGYAVLKPHRQTHGLSLPSRFRDRKASGQQLPHDFAVNSVLISALRLAHLRGSELFISRWEHDRSLRRKIKVKLPDGPEKELNPDGYLEFIYRSRWQIPLLAEVDRDQHTIDSWKEKIRKLVAYIKGDYHREIFGVRDFTLPTFVECRNSHRVDQLRDWTEQALDNLGARNTAHHFTFAHFQPRTDPPEHTFEAPIWSQPFSSAFVPLIATLPESRATSSQITHSL